jgi:Domain of unknown function (DUF4362)
MIRHKLRVVAIAVPLIAAMCSITTKNQPNNAPPDLPNLAFVEQLSETPGVSVQQRLRFVSAMEKGEQYGLRRTEYSVEGTPIHLSLTTDAGKLTFITDYRDDPYSTRQIYTEHPISVQLGKIQPGEQHALRAWFPSQDVEYLHCVMSDGKVEFF